MSLSSSRIAVLTFVYPLSLDYYQETLVSIDRQDCLGFEKIIVADAVELADGLSDYRVIRNEKNLSLIALREYVFNQLIDEGYDLIINIDADDTMAYDRVGLVVDAWEKSPEAALYYSPLHYMSDRDKPFFFTLPEDISSLDQVFDSNCVGLSHMAINTALMRKDKLKFTFPEYLIALDWYMLSWFLSHGYNAIRCSGCVFYRIYQDNIAGETPKLDIDKALRQINVKEKHYQALAELIKNEQYQQRIQQTIEQLAQTKAKLRDEIQCKQALFDINQRAKQNTSNYWWAAV